MVLGWGTWALMTSFLKKSYHRNLIKHLGIQLMIWFFLFLVIATVKTSRTRNRVSVVVFPTPRFASSIWAENEHSSRTSHCAFISSPMNMNSSAPKLWKPVVFAATNTWWSTAARINSTSACDCIHSTWFASIKCCRALELIGKHCFVLFHLFSP